MIFTLFDIVKSAVEVAPEASSSQRHSIALYGTRPQPLPSLYRMGLVFSLPWDEGVPCQRFDVDFRRSSSAELVKVIRGGAGRHMGRFCCARTPTQPRQILGRSRRRH
jgi:hypothetical protein